MPNHTYRLSEIVGSSQKGVDDAVRNGLSRASQTLRHLEWFEVVSVRGSIEDGTVGWYQVTMKVGFRLEGDE